MLPLKLFSQNYLSQISTSIQSQITARGTVLQEILFYSEL